AASGNTVAVRNTGSTSGRTSLWWSHWTKFGLILSLSYPRRPSPHPCQQEGISLRLNCAQPQGFNLSFHLLFTPDFGRVLAFAKTLPHCFAHAKDGFTHKKTTASKGHVL